MALPLLERATGEDARFLVTIGPGIENRVLPAGIPGAGEQYRFHFDMTRCIGCKCCEVACNEQNNNPAHLNWRRVGEIEAGEYPYTQRFHLSMGCNHCLDAACLKGCPVDAYKKDGATGIVLHSADACIGCQYCTWNCPYGVPQYNAERGVVGKCDMCYGRLTDERAPACVAACPEEAIRIEVVNIAEWRETFHAEANVAGMPPAQDTISTTRITRPEMNDAEFRKADYHRVRPEHPHWPLVWMLVLTQMSVGAMVALALTAGADGAARVAAGAALLIGLMALAASTAHLGRPIHAYRALKMWRRSWLSREVLCFGLFAKCAAAYAAALWLDLPFAGLAATATACTGILGVVSSACIYLVPARPAWNSWITVAEFGLTGFLLGPLLALSVLGKDEPVGFMLAAGSILGVGLVKTIRLARSGEFEQRSSARLLFHDLRRLVLLRVALLGAGVAAWFVNPWLALALLVAEEIVGRYLFFVSVVPRNMAAPFFSKSEAA
ncbi:MAG: dimethyl sulfoxide reductase anchor subunit [Bryobacterales bacterium]|nr:dimethyl sulfoxide reductase anchor subunit [Bryobacterales bacterium]